MRDGSQTRLLLTTWVPYTRTDAAEVQKIVFESLKAERHRRLFRPGPDRPCRTPDGPPGPEHPAHP